MQRERLGSRLGFILLSAGCAIGLGNVYRFPFLTGAYGGAFFVLIYLAFLVLLGLPVMVMEFAVGRASQRSIATSFDVLERKGQKWHLMKYLGIAANYLLMMCYTSITGWLCIYFVKYLTGSITEIPASNPGAFADLFGKTIASLPLNLIATGAVLVIGLGICAIGLKRGVERVSKFLMVALLILMIGLAVYSFTQSGLREGLRFYLMPSGERLVNSGVWTVISAAMGQAFFTLSLGIGSMAIFGSYIGKERSLVGESLTVIGLDTFVALMAGLIIFPAYFTFNPGATEVEGGMGLLFITLSNVFANMGPVVGRIVGTLFFLFMVFAAMSTVIAVFENITSFWLEKTNLKRWQIALINLGLFAVLCLPFIFCFHFQSWGNFTYFLGKNFADFEDFLVSNLALPIGSLAYALFCTWKFGWGWDNFFTEANLGKGIKVPNWIRPYVKFVLPLIILVVLVFSIVSAF